MNLLLLLEKKIRLIINDLSKELRKTLVAKCTELFGVDLTRYEHGATNGNSDSPEKEDNDIIEFNVDEIEMIMKNGKLIIKRIGKENEKENG